MNRNLRRLLVPIAVRLKKAADAVVGRLAVLLLRAVRLTNPDTIANAAGAFMRRVGPWMRENEIGRANLVAAFPEKSPDEIDAILAGAWDNLGRMAAEFAHLDRFRVRDPARPGPAQIDYDDKTLALFQRLRDDGKPALIFASHLGNWELPALVASAYKLDTAILYRRPNLQGISDAIEEIRAGSMGTLVPGGPDAPYRLARVLDRGGHVAMLVDQYYGKGVDVTFFGRTCKANPMFAILARHYDCPIHGTRIVRLPGHHFRAELTDEITPPRDAKGRIDVQGTMQVITSVIEGWIREHPEQWLWQHRRWR